MADYDPKTYWDGVASHMSKRAENVEVAGDDTPHAKLKRAEFVTQLLSRMSVSGRSILEVGSGGGGNLAELVKRSPARLVGVDIAGDMLDLARERVKDTRAELVLLDGTHLPFDDDEFDIAFTATVLQHNNDQTAAELLAEMGRIANEVWIFEDTSLVRFDSPSYRTRTTTDYLRLAGSLTFVEQRVLPIGANDRLQHRLDRLYAPVHRFFPRRGEGHAVNRVRHTFEGMLHSAVRPYNRRSSVVHDEGLTLMRFVSADVESD